MDRFLGMAWAALFKPPAPTRGIEGDWQDRIYRMDRFLGMAWAVLFKPPAPTSAAGTKFRGSYSTAVAIERLMVTG